ncbi:hypothetical protein PIB30_022528 [Stylosanthes scabra]|uniref:Uncharacterized protein n=1 Tax=Stylosanthes scabra TaxID=79078 RepID=A0ABU6WCQ3_9FABA|nr:hypothetical protein [Stylosanthes scabra]
MGSGVISYEYEKREKFKDYDMKADAELGTFKIKRYHFDDESFVHPLHSVRFDPDRPYEIPIEALMANKILISSKDEKSSTRRSSSSRRPTLHYSSRRMLVAQQGRSTSSVKGTRSFHYGTTNSSLRKPRSWELIPPSEGWMCDGDDEKEIGGMEPSVKKDESSEEDPEEDPEEEEEEPEGEDNPEDGIPATPSLPMDIDAEDDYLRYIEELERPSEPSRLRSSQASEPDAPVEASDRQTNSRNGSSYELSEVWQSPSSGILLSLSLLAMMRLSAPHPPRPAGSLSSSISSGSSGSFHRERERSPRTRYPPPAPIPVPRPMHPVPRTPMMDARRYRSLFPRRRVSPPIHPTFPTLPPSGDEPSVERIDPEAELEGNPEEPYLVGDTYLGGREVYSSDASYGSEHESASVGFGPSSRHSSGSSSGSGLVGYGSVTSGSASDASSDDDLVNRHFAGTFP